jgi:hypothetical protein
VTNAPISLEHGSAPPPGGELRFAWFDGILEGPRGDDEALRAAESRLAALGIVRAAVQTEGTRFNLLIDDDALPGPRFEAVRDRVFDAVQAIVAAAHDQGEVESTLRLTEVYADGTREMLLGVIGRDLRPVWRDRATTQADLMHLPGGEPTPPELQVGRRNLALAFAAFLMLSGLVAWQSGWVGRMLVADVGEIAVDAGPFAGVLACRIEKRFGRYEVFIEPGPDYPRSPDAVEALRGKSSDLERRAAIDVVAGGGELYVRLERADGVVLEARRLRTATLLGGAAAQREVLDGRISGARIALALSDGRETRERR